jgi:hypothetical protein
VVKKGRNREKANVWKEQKSSLVALCAQRIDLNTVYDSVPIKLRESKNEKKIVEVMTLIPLETSSPIYICLVVEIY